MSSKIQLDKKEQDEVYLALMLRCAFIETGTHNRAKDLMNIKEDRHKIKVLSLEQMRTIILLEDIMARILSN